MESLEKVSSLRKHGILFGYSLLKFHGQREFGFRKLLQSSLLLFGWPLLTDWRQETGFKDGIHRQTLLVCCVKRWRRAEIIYSLNAHIQKKYGRGRLKK